MFQLPQSSFIQTSFCWCRCDWCCMTQSVASFRVTNAYCKAFTYMFSLSLSFFPPSKSDSLSSLDCPWLTIVMKSEISLRREVLRLISVGTLSELKITEALENMHFVFWEPITQSQSGCALNNPWDYLIYSWYCILIMWICTLPLKFFNSH